MAQEMESYVRIHNGDKKVAEKLKEIFGNGDSSIPLINNLYGKNYTWDNDISRQENEEAENTFPGWDWMQENVGAKWIQCEFDYDDNPDHIHLVLTTAYSVPQPYLKKLSEVLIDIKEDCYITGTYEEESYEPMGAFLYGKIWDDIEDYDDEIDQDKIWEDDFYMENIREEVEQMRVDIEKVYLEDLAEQNK